MARVPRRLAQLEDAGVLPCRRGRLSSRACWATWEEQRCGVEIGSGQETFWRSEARL